jgi:O-antigen ligase
VTAPVGMARPRAVLSLGSVGEAAGRAVPFLLGALAPGILAADQGGYWPTSWGWTAIALAWVGALALVLRAGRIGGAETVFVLALAALTGWTAISLLWTSSTTQTVLSGERLLVYVVAAATVAGAIRSAAYRGLLWGVWAGATADCAYGLATRLLPDRLGSTDVVAGFRLSAPVGYWNGLGLLAALAAILALGLAAFGRPSALRPLAAASLPLILPTLYLTFSRGAWLALAVALAAVLVLSDRRLALLVSLLVLAVPSAVAVWLLERAKPLHVTTETLSAQVRAGHPLLWQLPLLALGAAALCGLLVFAGGAVTVPPTIRAAFGWGLAAAGAAAIVLVVVHYGGPTQVAHHARDSFEGVTPGGTDLDSRLFSLSSNGRVHQWHIALDEWRGHRALGGGAGTYAQHWAAAGHGNSQILNAHSLYLETLAELGPVGLALLALALAAPLVAAVRARRRALVPIATGAYVAFLVHAAYDWDWQLAGVTVAALFCAGASLAAARDGGRPLAPTSLRFAFLSLVLVGGVLAFLGLLGNRALARSGTDLRDGDFTAAAAAADDARRWAPWSSQPWEQLAIVRLARGDRAGGRIAYRHAVAKDPSDWQLWLGLASVSRGGERAHALAVLKTLHPGISPTEPASP